MQSSIREFDRTAHATAERLTGEAVLKMAALPCSGNNRLYRIGTATAQFALKAYAGGRGGLQRLEREYNGVTFLNAYGATGMLPLAFAADRVAGFGLYEWIDGTPLLTHDVRDVDGALEFIACAHAARSVTAARALPAATDACLSAQQLFAQIHARFERLRSASVTESALKAFLDDELQPHFQKLVDDHRIRARGAGMNLDREINIAAQTLSPSDFSFHNALRRADGSLVFLDFEYFGWDDPVKLISDFLWHPAMNLSAVQAARFARGARTIFAPGDADYERRLRAYFPLFGLKWCLIILNEFLADDWNRRQFSGERRPWDEVKSTQLHKAHTLLIDIGSAVREGVLC